MSLRDLGVFAPLPEDHPLVRQRAHCPICERLLGVGVRTALVPIQTPEEAGSHTVEATAVCACCYLEGKEITTPVGRRTVLFVMSGAWPNPIWTTDGFREACGWTEEEVGL